MLFKSIGQLINLPFTIILQPLIISIPPGQPVFSIDVECVATGIPHNSRSIAQVALVDEYSRPVFNVLIKQDKPVVSYITPLTGLTKEAIDEHGLPLGKRSLLVFIVEYHTYLSILKSINSYY